jgi:hypothetical protein
MKSLRILCIASLGLLAGCLRPPQPGPPALTQDSTASQRLAQAPAEPTQAALSAPEKPPAPGFAAEVPYEAPAVTPQVKPYTVRPDLSNVANLKRFAAALSPAQKARLAQNAFVATPTREQQLFFLYENNAYAWLPSFITTDSVLQVYHVFYDYSLRTVERESLLPLLEELTATLLQKAAGTSLSVPGEEPVQRVTAFFAVASALLGKPPQVSPEVRKLVDEELRQIEAHAGRGKSAIFPFMIDYSQFLPRGHYTRSEELKRFFRAMMWYGNVPFPVEYQDAQGKGVVAKPQVRQALLITHLLFAGDSPLIDQWRRLYEPTAFYVGTADDLTPEEFKGVLDQVYGPECQVADLADEEKLEQAIEALRKLRPPRIKTGLVGIPGGQQWEQQEGKTVWQETGGWQFRFMGQRYIADSEILQRLSRWPERPFPQGLDVMAVLGSDRAAELLDREKSAWADYRPTRERLREEFARIPLQTWQSNLYWGWLWTIRPLLTAFSEGYPSFMTHPAWTTKSLHTALGGWAELRHDTLLYGKQSGVECGGEEEERPLPKSYVEPVPEFYARLAWLTKAARVGLQKRRLLPEQLTAGFEGLEDLLGFLLNCSLKELRNEELTRQEYEQLLYYGAELERLTLQTTEGLSGWYEITSETDKNMATIADVHTSQGSCLQVGVGAPLELLVVVPIGGKLYLTRGAAFSYYEFIHPVSDRLTDEKWQQMLQSGTAPPPPDWVKSFVVGGRAARPMPTKGYQTGC